MNRFSPPKEKTPPGSPELTEENVKDAVLYDTGTKTFCVADAIMLVQGCSRDNAKKTLTRLMDDEMYRVIFVPVFFTRMNGKSAMGCTFSVLCEVLSMLPGKTAREFRAHEMYTFAHALGGDLSLAADIERRAARLEGTDVREMLVDGAGASPAELALPPPEHVQGTPPKPIDFEAFFEKTCAPDPQGYVPADILHPLIMHEEAVTLCDKATFPSRKIVESLCYKFGFVISPKQRRMWMGETSTRFWMDGLALRDPAKSVADAKRIVAFKVDQAKRGRDPLSKLLIRSSRDLARRPRAESRAMLL
jgi:hypothetical protein